MPPQAIPPKGTGYAFVLPAGATVTIKVPGAKKGKAKAKKSKR